MYGNLLEPDNVLQYLGGSAIAAVAVGMSTRHIYT